MTKKSTTAVAVSAEKFTPVVSTTEVQVGLAYPAFVSQFKAHYPKMGILKSPEEVVNYDLILFSGGEDIDPGLYGQDNTMSYESSNHRDTIELEIMKECDRLGTLVYGSCRGLQLINVARGGTLYQDLLVAGIRHEMFHPLVWEQESKKLQPMFEKGVNSLHHQGIHNLGKDLFIYAQHNGIPEIIYGKNVMATQFHPELMDGMAPFFNLLMEWAITSKNKKPTVTVPAEA